MQALKRNSSIEVTYFACGQQFDITKYKNVFDTALLRINDRVFLSDTQGINQIKIPVISGTGDHQEN